MNKQIELVGIIPLLVFFIFSPSYAVLPGRGLGYFDNQRLMEILAVSVALICNLVLQKKLVINRNQLISNLMRLLFMCIVVSTFLSPSPRHALQEISLLIGLIYLSIFIAILMHQFKDLLVKSLLCAIHLGALIYLIGFFAGYLASFIEQIPLRWPEPFHGFTNLRFFNQYQLWTLALMSLPLLTIQHEKRSLKLLIFALISGWWMMLFASAGRGVLLALFTSGVATYALYGKMTLPFFRLQLAASLTGFGTHILLFRIIPYFLIDPLYSGSALTGSLLRFTTMDRLALWQKALTMIQEHPFFGVGPMHYAWYPNEIAAHPHNSILQMAAEWGIPASAIVLILSFYGLYRWLKTFSHFTLSSSVELYRHLPIILFFTLITNVLYSLVDGVIVMPMSQVMMSVLIGLMFGCYAALEEKQDQIHSINNIKFYKLSASITLVTLLCSLWPDLIPRITGEDEKIPIILEVEGPRFWKSGGIPH
jgi:putative inorganic carbon (hco3(-)) transporter